MDEKTISGSEKNNDDCKTERMLYNTLFKG